MSTDEKYNGWTNYETWAVNLWMENDEGSYNYWKEVVQGAYNRARGNNTFTREEQVTLDLAEIIQATYEETCPELIEIWG